MTNPDELIPITHQEFEEEFGIFPLKNLHQILAETAFEPDDGSEAGPMVHGDFRVEPQVKAAAARICEQNGGDLSKFLRGCLRTLVREYR